MKTIKLSKKDSKQITENLKQHGIPVKKDIKKITFHKNFNNGWQYAICERCGHVTMFLGIWVGQCSVCDNKKVKIFKEKDVLKFLSYQNKVIKKLWDDYKILKLKNELKKTTK